MRKTSNELFTMVNGEKSDAALHESILAEGDANGIVDTTGIDQARKCGLTETEIRIMYPDSPNFAEDMAAGKILSGADVNTAMQSLSANFSPSTDKKSRV